jgi:hypothetical protein
MVVIAIVKPIFGAKKQAGSAEDQRQDYQNQFHIHEIIANLICFAHDPNDFLRSARRSLGFLTDFGTAPHPAIGTHWIHHQNATAKTPIPLCRP